MPTCGLMTMTPLGAAYLVEGVIRSPFFPPLRRTFQVKTLTFWSGNGGTRGVTSSLEALLSSFYRLWGLGVPTLSTLFRRCQADALPPGWLKFV